MSMETAFKAAAEQSREDVFLSDELVSTGCSECDKRSKKKQYVYVLIKISAYTTHELIGVFKKLKTLRKYMEEHFPDLIKDSKGDYGDYKNCGECVLVYKEVIR